MLYKKLVDVRTAYQLMYEASENINKLFRWTLPINIANDFQIGLTNTFLFITFMLQWNEETSNWKKVSGPLIWAMYNIGHILILSSVCQQACEEAKMTPALLHQIDFTLSDQQVADLVSFHAATTLIAPCFIYYVVGIELTIDSCIFNANGSTEGHLHCIRTTQCRLYANFYCKHLFIDSRHWLHLLNNLFRFQVISAITTYLIILIHFSMASWIVTIIIIIIQHSFLFIRFRSLSVASERYSLFLLHCSGSK